MPHRLPPEGAFVCIVEDEPDVARMIATILRDFSFETRHCRTAAELRQQLRQRVPDLCIIDLGLPDADGMELVQEIQRQHDDCGLLILTGRAWVGDRVMGLELGADDYVTKPFSVAELIARINAIFRRQNRLASTDESFAIGPWSVNPRKHTLTRGRVSKRLTFYELEVLKLLRERADEAVSREELLDKVWGVSVASTNRTVDNFIVKLRRKLEEDQKNPRHILTVYGLGYKLVP